MRRQAIRYGWAVTALATMSGLFTLLGCYHTPVDVSDVAKGPAPLRMPWAVDAEGEDCCYEDTLTGGKIFKMYCAYCHDVRPLAERPFAHYRNVATHMRLTANLTGKEYAQLMVFLRRWHDIPPPEQNQAPSAKRFFFSQPIPELRDQKAKTGSDPVAGPRDGMNSELSPGQPLPGLSPREGR
jgi:hypothetical protein